MRVASPRAVSAGISTADTEGAPREDAAGADEREREETLSVATTSLAAVATAWSAFQAATWSGRQTFALARAAKVRELSTEARLEGNQQQSFDAGMFVAWASAADAGDKEAFAKFLYDRFPPRLKKATDAWLATKPRTSPDAPPHPLAMREYEVEAHQRALALGREADDAIAAGHTYNVESDTYVLGTVVFATLILLASLALRLRRPTPRRAMLLLSAAGLLAALAWLATRPIAWVG